MKGMAYPFHDTNFMKKAYKFIIISILVLVFLFVFYIFLSPRAFKARRNVSNTKNIQIGMNRETMLEFMGALNNTYPSYYDNNDTIYFYEPPFMASDGIEIYIGDNRIKRIVPYR